LLLPHGVELDEPVPTAPGFRVAQAMPPPLAGGKSRKLDKVWWEQSGLAREARRHHAQLLHIPYLAAPIRKIMPTVITAHDMIPWVVPGYKGSAFVQLYLALAAASAKRADLIIADSDASRRDVIRVLRVPPQKVHTVYLGVEPAQAYTPEQIEDVRARFGLPRHFAFYIGGFDHRKNVPLLLRAWRKAVDSMPPDDRPVLAIGGAVPEPGGVFPDVRGEASALGLMSQETASVRFLGRITEGDKPLLMAAAHVFVYPSAYEGFGLDPLEAMSVGCPVIASHGGSLREVVGDGGLLVSSNDEDELCRAIVRLWHDEGLRQRLSQSGRDHAKRFTWQRTAEQTLRLYSLALESAGKRT